MSHKKPVEHKKTNSLAYMRGEIEIKEHNNLRNRLVKEQIEW